MTRLLAQPISPDSFAPFGDVLVPPKTPSRVYFDGALASLRPGAVPRLSLSRVETVARLPLTMTEMERHEFSSQSFVPLGPEPYLVVVARDNGGAPDLSTAAAFIVADGVGVTYSANVWHHPLTVLAAPAHFAVFMWTDGTSGDEEFVTVPATLIEAP